MFPWVKSRIELLKNDKAKKNGLIKWICFSLEFFIMFATMTVLFFPSEDSFAKVFLGFVLIHAVRSIKYDEEDSVDK